MKRRSDRSEDDNREWTAKDFARARPASEILSSKTIETFAAVRGGPRKAERKIALSIRLSPDVVGYFKAGGDGWQTRIDEALRETMNRRKSD
jgi:uncharacterized protein (DUF4415 family)